MFAFVKRTAGRNCSFRESRNFWCSPDEVVDVLGPLLVDEGPRTSLIAFSSLSEYPLTPPTVKMNSAGSSILNCRNRSTLALTRLAVGASLMGAL